VLVVAVLAAARMRLGAFMVTASASRSVTARLLAAEAAW
jgi:hypothetical protein